MPIWLQWMIGIAAFITAMGALITKAIRPFIRGAARTEEMLPLMNKAMVAFRDMPEGFDILKDMARQFRTDSGSSLRDVVNRLEAASIENTRTNESLKIGVESTRILTERDRAMLDSVRLLLERLSLKVEILMESGARIEFDRGQVAQALSTREANIDAAAAGVATDLTERQRQIDKASGGVASDLAAAQKRADDTVGDSGAAADAASQSEEKK